MLDAKAKELADMIGEVSIKTVDNSEFDEGAIHNKQEVEEEGYMGGKVCHVTVFAALSMAALVEPVAVDLVSSNRIEPNAARSDFASLP